jgi:hypothetical protein
MGFKPYVSQAVDIVKVHVKTRNLAFSTSNGPKSELSLSVENQEYRTHGFDISVSTARKVYLIRNDALIKEISM